MEIIVSSLVVLNVLGFLILLVFNFFEKQDQKKHDKEIEILKNSYSWKEMNQYDKFHLREFYGFFDNKQRRLKC